MKRLLLTLAMLALPALAAAQSQTPPISALRVVVSGGVAPVTNDLLVANLTCGLAKSAEPATPTGTVHNPTEVDVDDVVSGQSATYCRYKDTGAAGTPSPLIGLPFGATTYTTTAQWVYGSAGPGPASAVSNPFDHPGVPGQSAPTGLRVTP